MEELKKKIREIPDFPKKGILFYDLTTLFRDRWAFATAVDLLNSPLHRKKRWTLCSESKHGALCWAVRSHIA